MPFVRAERTQNHMRLALLGPSGCGKTLSALIAAYGLTGDWSKIAVIDTEEGSACLYADRADIGVGGFLHTNLEAPFTPQKYIAAISEGAQVVGPDGVLIIDSYSHAWMGAGGVLEQKDAIAKRAGQNSYTAWNEAGRLQQDILNTILRSQCHIIVTMRTKDEYVQEENDKGKKTMRKIGLAPQQRDGVEYEFDIVLYLDPVSHRVSVSKDRTGIGQDGEVLTPEFGQRMKAWLSTAAAPAPQLQPIIPAQQQPPQQPMDAPDPMAQPQQMIQTPPDTEIVRTSLKLVIPGGPFEGWTLKQLFGSGDNAAMQNNVRAISDDPSMPQYIKEGVGIIWAYLAAKAAQ